MVQGIIPPGKYSRELDVYKRQIQGQTKDMIRYDIDCLKRYFKLGTVNVYNNNTTPIRRDQALVDWFMDEYQWLMEDPAVEVLYEITDFGVG